MEEPMNHLIRLLRAVWPYVLFVANVWLLMLMLVTKHWLLCVAWVIVLALDYNLYRKG